MKYPVPKDEVARNAAVRSYEIMESAPEIAYDDVTDLAAQICKCPISYVSFIERDRFWIKAKYGLPEDFNGCPREIAFCSVTICGSDIVNCADMTRDARFKDFPFVVNEPHYRFYCSVPLVNPQGYSLGTLCVMDFQPRELDFEQLEALRRLSRQLLVQLEHRRKLIELAQLNTELEQARAEAAAEKDRAEELLHNILPASIARELTATGKVEARFHPGASILFTDFEGFTRLSETVEPAMLIGFLDQCFSAFDRVTEQHHLEKVKTIGDAFMAVAGVPAASRCHCVDACLAALGMHRAMRELNQSRAKLRLPGLELRVGVHSGPVMAGVVGKHKFTYDVWGDAVNVAARLESHGVVGRTNVSDTVYNYVKPYFELSPRGSIEVKNKGAIEMYFLDRIRPEYAGDEAGTIPNARFEAERQRVEAGGASGGAPT